MFFFKKKKKAPTDEMDEVIAWGVENAKDDSERRYYGALADKQYQADSTRHYNLVNYIRERYSVLNALGSFSGADGDELIDRCAEAINLDIELKPKREYYENQEFNMSEPAKTLVMVFEKREEYESAAAVCALAIENGFTADGTAGGMRGRLARLIKKGNLPLTDSFKKILNLH